MRLRSRFEQKVHFANLDLTIAIGEGEEMLTEISSKFDPVTLPGELSSAGLSPEDSYLDRAGDFLLTLARR